MKSNKSRLPIFIRRNIEREKKRNEKVKKQSGIMAAIVTLSELRRGNTKWMCQFDALLLKYLFSIISRGDRVARTHAACACRRHLSRSVMCALNRTQARCTAANTDSINISAPLSLRSTLSIAKFDGMNGRQSEEIRLLVADNEH